MIFVHPFAYKIFILLLVCIIDVGGQGFQWTNVAQPINVSAMTYTDPGYIIAESTSGLSNRLRVLAAYMYVGEFKFQAKLVFIWDYTSACPGHFLQLFQPISNVIFATNSSRYVLDKGAKIVYEASNAVFTWTLQMNGIPRNRFGQPSWSQAERIMYSRYVPNRAIMDEVDRFVHQHHVCNISAMHIRTTDLNRLLIHHRKKPISLDPYYNFIENLPADEPVFLLTDSPDTQQAFIEKYGSKKIIVYSLILRPGAGNHHSHNHHSKHSRGESIPAPSVNITLPDDHRYTGIEHTLIDVFIAAHSKNFKGASFSSLTDLVHIFASIGREERAVNLNIVWLNEKMMISPLYGDNPTAIVAPFNGTDPGYIIATSDGGLANRLRVLVAYMYISKHIFDGAHLVFIWDVNDACPGHYLQLFQPLDNVIFTDSTSGLVLYHNAKKVFEVTRWPLESILMVFDIPKRFTGGIEEEYYAKIVPTKWIMQKVDDYVKQHHMCNNSAMHIRGTDMEKMLGTKKAPGNLERRFWYIEGQPVGEKVFFVTDSPYIQQKALSMFPDRVLIYERIMNATEQKPLSAWASPSAGAIQPAMTTAYENKTLPLEHRFTSLESALVDAFIAAHSKEFRGSPFSSFSDFIDIYRKIGRRLWHWCDKQ